MTEFRLVVEDLALGAIWVQLQGTLDAGRVYVFDQELRRAEARDPDQPLVLDLRELAFIDASGTSAFLAARRRAARADRRVVLVEGDATIRRVLRLAGLEDVFEVVSEIPAELLGDAGPVAAAAG